MSTALPKRHDDSERRRWIAEALGVSSERVFLGWSGQLQWALNLITVKRVVGNALPEGLTSVEIALLIEAGIVPTREGWTFAKENGR